MQPTVVSPILSCVFRPPWSAHSLSLSECFGSRGPAGQRYTGWHRSPPECPLASACCLSSSPSPTISLTPTPYLRHLHSPPTQFSDRFSALRFRSSRGKCTATS